MQRRIIQFSRERFQQDLLRFQRPRQRQQRRRIILVPGRGVGIDLQRGLREPGCSGVIPDHEILAGEIAHGHIVAGIRANVFFVAFNSFLDVSLRQIVIKRRNVQMLTVGLPVAGFVGLANFIAGLAHLVQVVITDSETRMSHRESRVQFNRAFVERHRLQVAFLADHPPGFFIGFQRSGDWGCRSFERYIIFRNRIPTFAQILAQCARRFAQMEHHQVRARRMGDSPGHAPGPSASIDGQVDCVTAGVPPNFSGQVSLRSRL